MRRALLLSFLVPAALAGCGEGGEQLNAEELVSRADAICAESGARFDQTQAESPANPGEASEQTDDLVEIASDALEELRNLRPPDELREPYDAYLEARGTSLELLEQGRDAARDQDEEAYATAQAKASAGLADRRKLAQAVGLKRCSAEE
jgi:hypothetical protein